MAAATASAAAVSAAAVSAVAASAAAAAAANSAHQPHFSVEWQKAASSPQCPSYQARNLLLLESDF